MNYKHDKELVIKKGIELFWTNGYHSLGVNQICNETGMTKGAFYNSFKSKESFLIVSIEKYGLLITQLLESLLSTKKATAYKRLLNLYRVLLDSQTTNNFKGCLVNNMMVEMAVYSESVASISEKKFNDFIKIIEPTVQKAQDDNDLTNSIDSLMLAELIHTTFFGLLTRAKSSKTSGYALMKLYLNTLKPNKIERI